MGDNYLPTYLPTAQSMYGGWQVVIRGEGGGAAAGSARCVWGRSETLTMAFSSTASDSGYALFQRASSALPGEKISVAGLDPARGRGR